MEELETDRKQQLDKLRLKLDRIRQSLNEDDTGNMNNVISKNSPEACLTYLMKLEKKGDPQTDQKHLCRVIDFYTRVFSNMPLGKHCQNETYARMLVRFAELKAIQDVKEAEPNFNLARSHCPKFAFVHISYAEFEHSHGNTKKAIHILQRAIEEDAKPKELLEAILLNLQTGKTQLACSEDKENALAHNKVRDSTKQCSESKVRISDGTGELHLPGIFSSGREPFNALSDDQLPSWRTGPQKRAVGLPGRVPILPFSIPETDDDDSEGKSSKKEDVFIPKSVFRQTPGPSSSAMITQSSSKKTVTDGDFHLKPPNVSPDPRPWVDEDQAMVDSTTTLLHRPDKGGTDKMEDTTSTFNQMVSSYSPESCQRYLCNLEKTGNPHTDLNFLNKLKDLYDKVFAKLPMVKYSKNESYVRMLVRCAELKGIEDPEEAEDHFIVLRSHCKGLAFVHVAHAQFEVSQGNTRKATSILHKAATLKAKPAELLETALANLKSGKKELMLVFTDQESPAAMRTSEPLSVAASGGNYAVQAPGRVPVTRPALPPQPVSKEPSSEWKIPSAVSRPVSSQEKHTSPPDARPAPCRQDSLPTPLPLPSTLNTVRNQVYQTPNNPMRDPYGNNSYITPVVKRNLEVTPSTAHTSGPAQSHSKALHQVPCTQTPQASITALSNETITIKGKQFFVLKMIGRGGSSKVYQVLDHKKQLFAVKQVNLEEADAQTVESYKNEIEHLNHLQQYSEQIIKLYDYEITDSCIYMLMECGNLDLNTWLKKRKTVNQLERKYYWKNMLEAVSTIHKHGIVHSDLKPANFVIVNASLKLIDFGIANQIQADHTSIMKDSQVGTINYMPPEAIRYTTSKHGKASSKISPKGDVWSLGCILYYMTYGKTPFQSITNQIQKLHAITDPTFDIEFPDIPEKDLLDVLKRCLVRDPRERISIAELLDHPYIQFQPQASPEPEHLYNSDLKKILNDLAALQSPNSIVRAANNLARMCNSGRKLDVAECVKSSHQS